jgi:3',5'-cyclic AMP phosphodiesterase CpdA
MKIIQITDLHLVRPGDRLFDTDPHERLRLCLADIARHHADADLLVVTGDLAHQGDPVAYGALRETLLDFPVPVELLIGNHDDRIALRAAFPGLPDDGAGFVQSSRDTRAGRLLFLDTNEPGTHAGGYCDARFNWLARQLAGSPSAHAFIFMHHPPGPIAYRPADEIGLRPSRRFLELVQQHQVRHIFFGHVHRPVSGSWGSAPFSALRGLNHQVWLDFAALDGIPCSLEPPAYAIIFLSPEAVVVHLHDFLDPSPKYLYQPNLTEDEVIARL